MKTTSVLICLSFLAFAAFANALPRPAERQLLGSRWRWHAGAADEKVPEHTPSLKPPKNAQKSAEAPANVILLGESKVGKTALFNYLRKGPPTHADHYSDGGTIAVPRPFMITSIWGDHHAEDLPFPLKVWDTGAGPFKKIVQGFARDAEIAVVMFDASDTTEQSWATALEWIGYAKQHGVSAIMIIANKAQQATPEQLTKVQQRCQAVMRDEPESRKIIAAWTLMNPSTPLENSWGVEYEPQSGLVNAIRITLKLAAAHRALNIASEPTNCTGTDCE